MDILSIAILIFIVLETANIIILYFKPDSKLGNGVAVFNAWEKSKEDKDMHEFIRYLVYWVAGTKLIFIVLLVVILLTAGERTKLLTALALVVSIASFYCKLYPIIKALDIRGQINPKGYSKTLSSMILGFIMMFSLVLVLKFLF